MGDNFDAGNATWRRAHVRDLWAHRDLGVFEDGFTFKSQVTPQHSCWLLVKMPNRLRPVWSRHHDNVRILSSIYCVHPSCLLTHNTNISTNARGGGVAAEIQHTCILGCHQHAARSISLHKYAPLWIVVSTPWCPERGYECWPAVMRKVTCLQL
jgi:hypothetical protein